MFVVFTPDDEPYLGRESVFHFDQVLSSFIEQQVRIGEWTLAHSAVLTPLQQVASEIAPSASSIALSIRELVRQGYLLSALILTRPLLERVATLSYIIENPSKVALWQEGWPHRSRPPLQDRMETMASAGPLTAGDGAMADREIMARALGRYNGLVHGDPTGALHGAVLLPDGRAGYTIGKDLQSPGRADEVCFETVCWLVVLLGRCSQLFPDA